jgi:hypothetical protein
MSTGKLRYSQIHHQVNTLKKASAPNLLFLDFDGVWIIPEGDYKAIIQRVNKLIQTYQMEVVLTTSHRTNMQGCINLLKACGFEGIISGRTELEGEDRAAQILNYLNQHDFHHFVILDDMWIDPLQDYLVHCNFYTGFDDKAYNEATKIMERQINS